MLAEFNAVPADELAGRLRACCAAGSWIEAITAGRPYPDQAALAVASDAATAALDDIGLAQALAGHPRIGERAHGAWSRAEQSGVDGADAALRAEIAAANAEYERRFGHVYLVCATGLGAGQLLAICRSRLANSAAAERAVVLDELAKINRLRLAKLLQMEGIR